MTRRFPNFCYLTIACLVLALNASAGLAQNAARATAMADTSPTRATMA